MFSTTNASDHSNEGPLAAAIDPASRYLVSEEASHHTALSTTNHRPLAEQPDEATKPVRPRVLSPSEEVDALRGLIDRLPFGRALTLT